MVGVCNLQPAYYGYHLFTNDIFYDEENESHGFPPTNSAARSDCDGLGARLFRRTRLPDVVFGHSDHHHKKFPNTNTTTTTIEAELRFHITEQFGD